MCLGGPFDVFTICDFAMSGISDPLVMYFMEENLAKDKKLKAQAKLIANLQLQHLNNCAELAHAFHERQILEERIRMYQSMLRNSRDRVARLEDHLSFYTGSNVRHVIHIDESTTDDDDMSLASDNE